MAGVVHNTNWISVNVGGAATPTKVPSPPVFPNSRWTSVMPHLAAALFHRVHDKAGPTHRLSLQAVTDHPG